MENIFISYFLQLSCRQNFLIKGKLCELRINYLLRERLMFGKHNINIIDKPNAFAVSEIGLGIPSFPY